MCVSGGSFRRCFLFYRRHEQFPQGRAVNAERFDVFLFEENVESGSQLGGTYADEAGLGAVKACLGAGKKIAPYGDGFYYAVFNFGAEADQFAARGASHGFNVHADIVDRKAKKRKKEKEFLTTEERRV